MGVSYRLTPVYTVLYSPRLCISGNNPINSDVIMKSISNRIKVKN